MGHGFEVALRLSWWSRDCDNITILGGLAILPK